MTVNIVMTVDENGEVDGDQLFDFMAWMDEQEERIKQGLPIIPLPDTRE